MAAQSYRGKLKPNPLRRYLGFGFYWPEPFSIGYTALYAPLPDGLADGSSKCHSLSEGVWREVTESTLSFTISNQDYYLAI